MLFGLGSWRSLSGANFSSLEVIEGKMHKNFPFGLYLNCTKYFVSALDVKSSCFSPMVTTCFSGIY